METLHEQLHHLTNCSEISVWEQLNWAPVCPMTAAAKHRTKTWWRAMLPCRNFRQKALRYMVTEPAKNKHSFMEMASSLPPHRKSWVGMARGARQSNQSQDFRGKHNIWLQDNEITCIPPPEPARPVRRDSKSPFISTWTVFSIWSEEHLDPTWLKRLLWEPTDPSQRLEGRYDWLRCSRWLLNRLWKRAKAN